MTGDFSLPALQARLEANHIRSGVLALQGEARLLIMERSGRIFGPFLHEDADSLLWISSAFASSEGIAGFVQSGDWNAGGERIWIAPEIQFSVRDRNDFWGTIAIPPQMDPGAWRLDAVSEHCWRLCLDATLQAYNLGSGAKELSVERLIRPAANPLTPVRGEPGLLEGVTYCGYEQAVTLSEARNDGIVAQSWNVAPLHPGGSIIIPSSPAVEVSDYFEPIDDQHLARRGHCIALRITGRQRYKVGIRAAHTFGRLGYFNRSDDGSAYLIVRNYFNNPSSPYAEEPPQLPGANGDSIHVYNDGGLFGGFGELECMGQAIGGPGGLSSRTDQQVLWVYAGPVAKIARIGWHLLGVDVTA